MKNTPVSRLAPRKRSPAVHTTGELAHMNRPNPDPLYACQQRLQTLGASMARLGKTLNRLSLAIADYPRETEARHPPLANGAVDRAHTAKLRPAHTS